MSAAQRKSSEVFSEQRTEQIVALSKKVFGRTPERVAFPGGTSRSVFVADMGDAPYFFARRENNHDAQIEGIVLKTLGPTGKVPRLKTVMQDWVIQEHIAGTRLPVFLDRSDDEDHKEMKLAEALSALVELQEVAHRERLQHRIPRIGTEPNWLWNRTGAAKRISIAADLPEPALDREALCKAMDVKRDEFVKWDARPGNAMVQNLQTLWFDWEDCGRSKALDDLAFVMGDEWTNVSVEIEERLLKTFLPFFNRSMTGGEAERYFRLFGVTHMLLRVRMATKLYHRNNTWWDRQYCLDRDKVGVTKGELARLVDRIERWSDGVEEWKPLAPWLSDLRARYELDI